MSNGDVAICMFAPVNGRSCTHTEHIDHRLNQLLHEVASPVGCQLHSTAATFTCTDTSGSSVFYCSDINNNTTTAQWPFIRDSPVVVAPDLSTTLTQYAILVVVVIIA